MLARYRQLKSSHKVAVIIAVVAFVWILSGQLFGSHNRGNDGESAEAGAVDLSKILKMEVLTAGDKTRHLVLYGATEANRKVNIKPETEGRLVEITAKEGSVVKEGQVILRLDVRDRLARIEQTKALLEQRKLEYEAAKSLEKKGFRTQVGLAESRTNLENAKAELLRATLDYDHTFIRAPFTGILEKVNADLGDYVAVGFFGGDAALATIVEYEPMLVVGQVAEQDRSVVFEGAPAKAVIGGKEAEGMVIYIGNVADPASRTFRVEVAVANSDRAIPTGVTAELRIAAGAVKAYHVSPSVLTLDDKGTVGVKVISDNGIVQFMPIKLLEDGKDGVWIGGLPEKITLITAGQSFAAVGQQVPAAAANAAAE